MRKLLRILIFISLFFFLSYCASNVFSENIDSTIQLSRTLGNNEVDLDLAYFSAPVGSFTIDEIWIENTIILEPKKRAEASVGCNGIVFSAEGVTFKEKVHLDENKSEIVIKTKWTGENKRELLISHTIPPIFKIASISNEISKTQPLKIELKEVVSKKDWDSCSIKFTENQQEPLHESPWSMNVQLFSKDKDSNQANHTIEILLSQIQKQNIGPLPSKLYFQLKCIKEFKSLEKVITQGFNNLFSQNTFRYELKTMQYQLAVVE